MRFTLSSEHLVNAGGGFLFLVVGILILVITRRARSGRRPGWFALTFGLIYALSNLVEGDDVIPAVVFFVLGLVAALCLGLLVGETLHQVPPAARRRVAALAIGFGLGAGIIAAGFVIALLEDPGLWTEIGPGFLVLFPLQFLVEPLLLVLLAACGQAPLDGSLTRYKGRLMLGLAAGLFAVNIIVASASADNPDPSWTGHMVDGVEMLFGALAASAALFVLRGRPPGAERFARRAFAAIVIAGLVGSLMFLFPEAEALGPYGILRTVGAVLLVLAVVKYELLGVPLPRIVVRRGALAGGALAVLFVVAQVAQNFFSAKYGLLMGGILAGGFVFAASPIQRAIERFSDQQKPTAAASSSASAGYKAALRAAMRDGTLTRREERHLAEVAMALGISPVRALDLRDEVEREGA